MDAPIYIPTDRVGGFPFLHAPSNICYSQTPWWRPFWVSLTCISLITSGVEHLSMCLVATWVFLGEMFWLLTVPLGKTQQQWGSLMCLLLRQPVMIFLLASVWKGRLWIFRAVLFFNCIINEDRSSLCYPIMTRRGNLYIYNLFE